MHDFSKYCQCSVKDSLDCSILICFHVIASNINAKSSNNNIIPIYDFELSFILSTFHYKDTLLFA